MTDNTDKRSLAIALADDIWRIERDSLARRRVPRPLAYRIAFVALIEYAVTSRFGDKREFEELADLGDLEAFGQLEELEERLAGTRHQVFALFEGRVEELNYWLSHVPDRGYDVLSGVPWLDLVEIDFDRFDAREAYRELLDRFLHELDALPPIERRAVEREHAVFTQRDEHVPH